MKMLFAVVVVLCAAGTVRAQAAGEDCGTGNTCAANLVCQAGKCRNKIGADCTANAANQCPLTAQGGGACPASGPCACISDAEASGDNTACVCTDGNKVIYSDGSKCGLKGGQTCTATADCLENGNCPASGDNKKCGCGANFVLKSDNTMCLKKAGQQCADASECLTGATCTGSAPTTCTCPNGASGDNTKCLSKIGEGCSGNDYCVANAMCDTNCKCNNNYHATHDMKMCRLAPEQTCTDDNQCGENAACTGTAPSKKCTCKSGFPQKDSTSRCGKTKDETCTICFCVWLSRVIHCCVDKPTQLPHPSPEASNAGQAPSWNCQAGR